MAVYKLFPIKDATIYSGYPAMNTGLDALLEITNEYPLTLTPSPRVARSLIQFDQNEIDNVLSNKATGSWESKLKTYISVAQGITLDSISELVGKWFNYTIKKPR